VHRAAPELVDLIRSLKPFTGGNISLRTVHDLDIQDKHTGIIPAVGYVRGPRIGIGAAFVGNAPRILNSGKSLILDDLADAREGSFPLPVKMVFHPASGFADREIVPTLQSLAEEFTGIVNAFETLVLTLAKWPP
jgi:hypothetical protein